MSWVDDIEYVVFSGGGVRGLAFIGAWGVLRQHYHLCQKSLYGQLRGFAGTSAGALVSLMVSLGCDETQMMQECAVLSATDIVRNVDVLNFADVWGLHDREELAQRIRSILHKYANNADISYRQLYQQTGKTLVSVVARVNDAKALFYSHMTMPDLEVWRGVLASMSIPVLFAPSRIGPEILVDGGLVANLPLDVFPLHKTMAFLLTRTLTHRISGIKDYIMRVLYLAMDALERNQLESVSLSLRDRIIRIDTGNISSVEFSLTDTQRQDIEELGRQRMLQFLGQFAAKDKHGD